MLAVGKASEPADRDTLSIAFGGHWTARNGLPVEGYDGAPVAAHLAESGVTHPVTAVLLNYRGYDTLLEIAVLLLALLAQAQLLLLARRSCRSRPAVMPRHN